MPWLSFRILDMDTQPYYIIFAVLIVVININNGWNYRVLYLFALFVGSVGVAIAYGSYDSNVIRSLAIYATPFIVTIAFLNLMKKIKSNFIWHIYVINFVWILIAILQKIFGVYVFDFLVEVRTSSGRGVTSLAPEPTHFAIFLIFISLIILKFYKYVDLPLVARVFIFLNICSVFFLASSAMGALLLVIIIFWFFITTSKLSIFKVIFSVSIVMFCLFFYQSITSSGVELRLVKLLELVLDDGVRGVLAVDESVNLRIKALVHSVYGSVDNYFVPQGFTSYQTYSLSLLGEMDGLFWTVSNGNKIMSGFGAPLYELGVFSFMLFVYMFSCVLKSGSFRIVLFESLVIPLVMFTAITISFAPFLFLLALGLVSSASECNSVKSF